MSAIAIWTSRISTGRNNKIVETIKEMRHLQEPASFVRKAKLNAQRCLHLASQHKDLEEI